MSLNRYEQAVVDYWQKHPDERAFWMTRTAATGRDSAGSGDAVRALERDLWAYFVERSQHVAALSALNKEGIRRVSLLNLAEYVLRMWGPIPKPKPPPAGVDMGLG
jgi:hypothetical protein